MNSETQSELGMPNQSQQDCMPGVLYISMAFYYEIFCYLEEVDTLKISKSQINLVFENKLSFS